MHSLSLNLVLAWPCNNRTQRYQSSMIDTVNYSVNRIRLYMYRQEICICCLNCKFSQAVLQLCGKLNLMQGATDMENVLLSYCSLFKIAQKNTSYANIPLNFKLYRKWASFSNGALIEVEHSFLARPVLIELKSYHF